MATGAIIASSVLGAGASYLSHKGQKEQAKAGSKAARRRARAIAERNALEQAIAKEKFELEVAMEEERIEHETEYIINKLEKKERKLTSGATAGYAASGVDVSAGGSAKAVLSRIEREAQEERESVIETGELRLKQFKESGKKSLDWFLEQSEMETRHGVQSERDIAKAFSSQATYAGYGMILGPIASGVSGVANYASYSSSISTTALTPSNLQASQGPGGLLIQ